jgi:hypothetical protein
VILLVLSLVALGSMTYGFLRRVGIDPLRREPPAEPRRRVWTGPPGHLRLDRHRERERHRHRPAGAAMNQALVPPPGARTNLG